MKETLPARNYIERVKKRTFSGVVCEQEVFYHTPSLKKLPEKTAEPRLRFRSAEERAQHRLNMSRKRFVQLVNSNFTPAGYYVTLTFDDDHIVYERQDAKKEMDKYIRRLRRKFPSIIAVYVIEKGKNTERIHAHMIIEKAPRDYIVSKWGEGLTHIKKLREHCFYDGIDHGADYKALAEYMLKHSETRKGKHRYYRVGKLKKPEIEEYTEVKRNYSEEHPPKAPKGYKLVEIRTTRYGYMYFKYVLDSCLLPDRSGRRRC